MSEARVTESRALNAGCRPGKSGGDQGQIRQGSPSARPIATADSCRFTYQGWTGLLSRRARYARAAVARMAKRT
jgi:hypothetical protein